MLGDGSLFFPVTPSDDRGGVVVGLLREHLDEHLEFPIGGVFAACGTGEFTTLSAPQITQVVGAARSQVRSAPVFGPAGGPLGHARECARRSRDAGADGLLLMSPYAGALSPAGHARYLEAVLTETDLPALLYHRADAPIAPETLRYLVQNVPQLVGLKDGVGDLSQIAVLKAIGREHRGDFLVVNGLSLAEGRERAYRSLGIHRYTSALFTMDPRLGAAYLKAREGHETGLGEKLLERTIRPLELLRDAAPGYAVSLVKAAVRLSGIPVGPVRPPYVDITSDEEVVLSRALRAGREALGGA